MIQRNVVFQSKTDTGESVLNMPITVLKNIEDTAEIKDNISDDDYVPVIDSSDNSQMKKTNFKNAIASKADKSDVEAALDNKSNVNHIHDERYYTESEVDTKLSGKIDTTLKGSANGIAELNENGKVPSSQLPSYVDAVVEYTSISDFPSTGDTGKIYVDTTTNLTYRWSGSAYVEISPSIALGETSSTAYRGDRGKAAYDHIADTTTHITAEERAAWDAKAETDTATATSDGLMSAADKTKLDGIAVGANNYVHPTNAGNKHIPSGGTDNQILAYSADGAAKWSSYSYVKSFIPILGHISAQNPTAELLYQSKRNRCILLLFANYLLVNDTNPKFISASRFIDFSNGADTTLDKTDIVNINGCENPVYITIGKNSDGKCRILLEGTSNVTYLAFWYNM